MVQGLGAVGLDTEIKPLDAGALMLARQLCERVLLGGRQGYARARRLASLLAMALGPIPRSYSVMNGPDEKGGEE